MASHPSWFLKQKGSQWDRSYPSEYHVIADTASSFRPETESPRWQYDTQCYIFYYFFSNIFWCVYTLWSAGLTPAENHKIVVRATDKVGKVQTAEIRPPFPKGNTGYHVINI